MATTMEIDEGKGQSPQPPARPSLPVTVLSGFLGSGKTTLLKHILTKRHGMQIAVIVNDMAELNIDASLVKNAGLVQANEELVQLENGCICCTLRADLLREVARLAQTGTFDYCVIESTGISEPMQVAETFTMAVEEGWDVLLEANAAANASDAAGDDDQPAAKKTNVTKPASTSEPPSPHAESHEHGEKEEEENDTSLHTIARLDTCVTVVDASSMMSILADTRTVSDTEDKAAPEDERSLAELLVDQIEFANVILLNKIDAVSPAKVKECMGLLIAMNPDAKIIPTRYSRVPLEEILNTGKFDMDKASAAPGWLKSMREELRPESEEYGISSFVYRRRRPFHPKRLFELLHPLYLIQEYEHSGEEEDDDDEGTMQDTDDEEDVKEDGEEDDGDTEMAEAAAMKDAESARLAKNREQSAFAGIVRSKGFIWLAHGNDIMGNWSQAGAILTATPESPWLCLMPEDFLEQMDRKAVEEEMEGAHGDRRQEVVFIGRPDRQAIEDALDKCLVTDEEWATATYAEPGFQRWPEAKEYLEADEEEDDDDAERQEEQEPLGGEGA